MTHRAFTGRRLLLAPALTIAVVAPLALASPAAACWCAPGMHESSTVPETCVPDTPAPQPAPVTTTETPAPTPTTETPPPAPETPAAPAPAPAAVVEAPAPAPAPAAPVVASAAPVAPVAAEEEQGAVLGERVSSKPKAKKKAALKATAPAPATETAPVVQTAAATGQLPFTGLDSGLVAIMGAGLLGTGVVLRRRTQQDG